MPDPEISNKESLKDLLVKRSSIKGQITKFKNYIDKISRSTDITSLEMAEVTLRLAKFETLSTKFDNLQTEIEVMNAQSIQLEIDERDRIESEIIQNVAAAKSLIAEYNRMNNEGENRRESTSSAFPVSDQRELGFKLPQIQISKFDGSHFRWLDFRDTFSSLVHNNKQISDVHKFHYLISYLEGDAARIVSNLEVSSSNYKEAWQLLLNRFDNKRILINHHLDSLFNLQIQRESEKSLRFLVDHVTKNLRALASLEQKTDHWDVLIIYMLSSKLDSRTLLKWEEHRNTLDDVPSLEQFKKFLIDRADVLESLNRSKPTTSHNNNAHVPAKQQFAPRPSHFNQNNNFQRLDRSQSQNPHQTKSFAITQGHSTAFLCIVCNGNHRIYDCPNFQSKNIKERLELVEKYKLCQNCLRQGHPIQECRLGPCRQCKQKHNSLLHDPNRAVAVNFTADDQDNHSVVTFSKQNTKQVLLSTAMIEVCNPKTNKREKVRALLDCGSQSSFITKSMQQKLQLKSNPIESINVIGIGNSCAKKAVESSIAQLKSTTSDYNVTLAFYVLDDLTGELPKAPINLQNTQIPKSIELADPKFCQPAPIEVLIGADLFWDVLQGEQISLGPSNPKLQKTKFGWIVAGPIQSNTYNKNIQCNHVIMTKSTVDQLLPKFWELEELPQKKQLSEEEEECEKHYLNNTTRLPTGRFCVKLPLKDSPDCLGDSYKQAKRRFLNLEKRFQKNSELKTQYTEFIREYADLGHLTKSHDPHPNPSYYLCHHAVFKEESESTKTRVVFDGSAPTTSGYSVNDILMVGPNMQDSLFAILIRARQYKFILAGDIAKMYRQVEIADEDRDLQLILWREDESKPIQTLRLSTVTYGTASASYLSTRCLWQVGEECRDEMIKTIIQKDFYVDDLITGADNEEQLQYIQISVSSALNAACFPLRKYKSNLPTLFQNSDLNTQEKLTLSESSSTLGIGWDPSTDTINFPTNFSPCSGEVTKRSILSNAFRIFDPLGILSPCIILPKILIQRLWQKGIDWDEPVPQEIKTEWSNIAGNLPILSKLQIPRRVLCDSPKSIEFHSFSDASQHAFGACLYARSIGDNNDVTVRLLCAKSKVAPLKPTTIPRLELCAALLASKLCKMVMESIRYTPSRLIHWCDSSIVLCWINNDTKKLKTFVANRIGEIKESTKASSWRYVPTNSNPADLISRGVSAGQLCTSELWWKGPSYLYKDESEWPKLHSAKQQDIPELKANIATTHEVPEFINFEKYSNFSRLQRIFAYVNRFIRNLKSTNKTKGILTVNELKESFNILCQFSQKQSFQSDYKNIINNKPVEPKSKLLALSPFFDEKTKLIRVGGRLEASNYSFEKKHPILLDSSHRLTRLYFEREHLRNLHAGPQLLLSTIRQTVWPLNGRKLARRVSKQCVICTRIRGQTLTPKMGNLPAYRSSVDFPFKSVGVDYAGPFLILNRKGRGARLIKCYLCLFVCLRYKCVHLEPVGDLTKESYIMTLRRFIARRGKPTELFSDNGGNFVAAAKDLSNFLKGNHESFSEFATQEGITFNFIPAYAPHMGGIWEAGVRSAKFHIKRVMGNTHLTFEEISTLFAQVEAMLNSRPLCPLSSSPDDFLTLSPGHFIIGRPLNSLPAPALENHKEHALKRHARLEQIRQHFWNRWQREYVSELQLRTKWKTDKTKINIGDLVLLQEDNVPPLSWRLGRVVRLYPGSDGISRVADIKTSRSCVRRPLVRLCPLPTSDELQV